MMKTFAALSLALTASLASAHEMDSTHTHSKGHKCACDAIVLGFTIDCDNTQAVTDALARLQANQCASNCMNEACEKDWLILQSHHDHCPMDALPIAVENGFHDYDRICRSCDIVRKEIPGAPTCPTVNCGDGSGNAAYQRLLTKSCNLQFQCTQINCRDDWLTLRMVHDTCEHGSLSQAAEEGMHALEEPCAEFTCNLPQVVINNSMECFEDELESVMEEHGMHDDHDDENPSDNKGGFDMSGVSNKLAAGSILAMAMAVAALF